MAINWIKKRGKGASAIKDIEITCAETEYGFIFNADALSKIDPDGVGAFLFGKDKNRIYFMPEKSGYPFVGTSRRFSVSKGKIEKFMRGEEMPTGSFDFIFDNSERLYYIEF